jgi:MFS family permease
MITLGILLAYVAGFGLAGIGSSNWRWMLGLGAVPGAALAISMIFAPHTPRWLGRRVILLSGTVVATCALIALGFYFLLPGFATADPRFGLLYVIVYIAGFAFSLGPVFWLMISEIFPLAHRSKAMAVCTIVNWAANFIVSYFFLQEIGLIGKPATFWIHAFIGMLATGDCAGIRLPTAVQVTMVGPPPKCAGAGPAAERGAAARRDRPAGRHGRHGATSLLTPRVLRAWRRPHPRWPARRR